MEMKSSERERDKRLLRLLRGAYLGKENLETGNGWQEEVMRRVRRTRNVEAAPSSSVVFFQFAWKLAPVTLLLILALTAILIASGLSFGYGPFEFGLDAMTELI